MKAERNKTLLKLDEFMSNLTRNKDQIEEGNCNTTVSKIMNNYPDENDIKFLTGTSLDEKKKKIDNFKGIVQKTLNNVKERKLKEGVVNHFKPILQYLNKIANSKYALFPLMAVEDKKFPLRIINKNIQKGDLILNLRRIKDCPEKRYFFIRAKFNYKGNEFDYESKINKNGGEMNHSHTFNLETERKINSKIGNTKVTLSIHKQHRFLLFKYRVVSEIQISLSRLLHETNAIFQVEFPYKDNKTLQVDLDFRTHEAIKENLINLKLLGIKRTFPPIDFIRETAPSKPSNVSK